MIRDEIESVETASPNILVEQTEQLKLIFPQAFSEGKVDFKKLRAALGDIVDDQPERYSFSWAGKRNATQLLQTPSFATLNPAEDESINFESTQNLFLEGDNLVQPRRNSAGRYESDRMEGKTRRRRRLSCPTYKRVRYT